MNSVRFVVPVRTRSALNLREHWAKKAARVKHERQTMWIALTTWDGGSSRASRARAMLERPGSIVVTLTRVAPRLMDDDNLAGALKACRDQVATHLRVDDRDSCVRWVVEQRKGGVREYAVEVRIEPRSATCPACGSVVGAVPAGGAT